MKKFLLLLFIFFIAYYILKAVTRLVKLFVEKRDQNLNKNSNNFSQENTIIKNDRKKKFEKNDGEYVDFEEIK